MRYVYLMLISIITLSFHGCDGGSPAASPPDGTEQEVSCPYSGGDPCAEGRCPQEKAICYGNPDGDVICRCLDHWLCDSLQTECVKNLPAPIEGLPWTCTLDGDAALCELAQGEQLDGDFIKGWSCDYDKTAAKWICRGDFSLTPEAGNDGSQWVCSLDQGLEVTCRRP